MNLSSIKLAGFKSFVDPTTIKFQRNLTAILGPNGCGKSNIVDAIRWVIGESSAKNLRAESMADVIFNGTTNRKPVGQASIELTFDNSDGRLGGEYAEYSTISVRRVLQRDGQSTYYLNGTRCRRRDILGVFMGTGLGPRSYSIIEQGMISKLIEAKPDDLRVFLEEASGISKYKDRRRETETRIRHTRDNLERLADVREELEKQLAHLKRQANAAERYQTLQSEVLTYKAQLYTMQWHGLSDQGKHLTAKIIELETQQEGKVAELRSIDAKLEELRENQAEQTIVYDEVQSRYYQLGTEITRLEQQLSHAKERKAQIEDDLEKIKVNQVELEQQLNDDQLQLDEVGGDIENIEASAESYAEEATASQGNLEAAEEAMQDWQHSWDQFQRDASNITRQVDVEQTKADNIEQRINGLTQRLEAIREQIGQTDFHQLSEEINELEAQYEAGEQQQETLQTTISQTKQAITDTREQLQHAEYDYQDINGELQKSQAHQSSLQALQQTALGKDDQSIQAFLEETQLTEQPRVAEQLQVTAGWEKAVEMVLGRHLDAICINGYDNIATAIAELTDTDLSFVNLDAKCAPMTTEDQLASKIQTELPIQPLLDGIYVATTLEQAFARLSGLANNESIITTDGVWMSQRWLKLPSAADEKSGVIARQQEIERLETTITEQTLRIDEQQQRVEQSRQTLHSHEETLEDQQQQYRDISSQFGDIKANMRAKQAKLEQLQSQHHRLQADEQDLQAQIDSQSEARAALEENLSDLREQAETHVERQMELEDQKASRQQALEEVKNQAKFSQQKADEMQVRLQSTKSQMHYLEQGIERATHQLNKMSLRREELTHEYSRITDPLAEQDDMLETYLQQRLDVEKDLEAAKQKVNLIDASMRELDKSRHQLEELINEVREQSSQAKMTHQTVKVKTDTLLGQLCELGVEIEQVLLEMPEDANPAIWQENIASCEQKIQRLGAINLAAIEEYEQLSERKNYLDQQDVDLNEALDTLENAIKKIDKETRHCFKETFDLVNGHFMNYFPSIFGGGHATLELTGDDLLNTGVTVKAQPPGKRNASIHALSGGEKALTAIALVFSFFQLNPAPFCILDEVDAPLDDANVARYCKLVKGMSEKVQFIFITHNKVTMEMAEQLVGITMQEPGVSRPVTVDISDALEMVEA